MRLFLLAAAASLAAAFGVEDEAPMTHAPLGVNVSWLGEKVAAGELFVARATTHGFFDDRDLDDLRSKAFEPYYELQERREPELSLRGDGGAVAAPAPGLLDWLLDSMGDAVAGDTARDVRLSAVLRLEKLFAADRSDATAATAVAR